MWNPVLYNLHKCLRVFPEGLELSKSQSLFYNQMSTLRLYIGCSTEICISRNANSIRDLFFKKSLIKFFTIDLDGKLIENLWITSNYYNGWFCLWSFWRIGGSISNNKILKKLIPDFLKEKSIQTNKYPTNMSNAFCLWRFWWMLEPISRERSYHRSAGVNMTGETNSEEEFVFKNL